MLRKELLVFTFLVFMTAGCSRPEGSLAVTGAWGREPPPGAVNQAFYLVIEDKTDQADALISVQADVCGAAELHEVFQKEAGVMGMRPVPGGVIPVLAGETVELKPGGLHIMCLEIARQLAAGDEILLTLTFEKFGTVPVTAVIREN